MTDQHQREEFARNLGLTREKAEAYYRRSLEAFDSGDFENALLDVSEAIYYDRGFAEFYATRGLYFLHDLKFAEAETDLNYAIRLNKREWLAHYCLGILDFQAGQYAEAFAHFDAASHHVLRRPEVLFYRAVAAWYVGKDEQAKADMTSVLGLLPDDDKRRREAQAWLKEFGVKGGGEAKAVDKAADKKKTGETKAVTPSRKR